MGYDLSNGVYCKLMPETLYFKNYYHIKLKGRESIKQRKLSDSFMESMQEAG